MATIRKFEADDAPAVSAVIRLALGRLDDRIYPRDRLQPLIDYFSPEKVARLNLHRHCLVAEDGGVIVATAALEGPRVSTFFVHPDRQRIGIGTRLLSEIEAAAQGFGMDRLVVQASLPAAPFYERHGYRSLGTIEESPAGPHLEMAKNFRPEGKDRWNAAGSDS